MQVRMNRNTEYLNSKSTCAIIHSYLGSKGLNFQETWFFRGPLEILFCIIGIWSIEELMNVELYFTDKGATL